MTLLLWVLVGAFVGWHVPQPFWAKMIQEAVVSKWKALTAKK